MEYYVLADENTVLGFGLVGVKGTVVTDRATAETAFKEVISDNRIGIIIITERCADLIRSQVDHYVFSEKFPLIVEVPDRLGRREGSLSIREMANQAIGIKL